MGKQQTEEVNEEKELLKEYLNQYYACRLKKRQLESRLKAVQAEMNTPIGGVGYKPVNYSTNIVGPGAASFVYRMGEIETRIADQKDRVEIGLLKIMDIMDFLDANSTERMILELRYIDLKKWDGKNSIAKELHLSRSSCFDYHNKALEKLLSFKKVRAILEKYKKDREQ